MGKTNNALYVSDKLSERHALAGHTIAVGPILMENNVRKFEQVLALRWKMERSSILVKKKNNT